MQPAIPDDSIQSSRPSLKEAIDIVAAHQRWRRGEVDRQEHSHRVIGRALDVLLDHARGAL